MRFFCLMEWNLKAPLEWDWESLAMYSERTVDFPSEIDGGKIFYDGSIYKFQGNALPSFEMGHNSSFNDSILTYVDSSLQDSAKRCEEDNSSFQDIDTKKEIACVGQNGKNSTLSTPICSREEMIGLKLGRSKYSEDMHTTSNTKSSSFSTVPASSSTSVKRSRVSYQSMQTPRCQVEECNFDLTSAKDYHRRHRICESHSKSPKVIVAGMERRFCQQCSRFHELSEFDDKKRSCRRRLSDHNARRRRPQLDIIQHSSTQLQPSSLFDQRSPTNFLVNGIPVQVSNPTWDEASTYQVTLARNSRVRSVKAGGEDMKLHFSSDGMQTSISIPTFQGLRNQLQFHGLEAPTVTSGVDAPPDFQHARSLLSTPNFGFNEPKATSLEHHIPGNTIMVRQEILSEQNWSLSSPGPVELDQVHPEYLLNSLDWHRTGSHLFKTQNQPNCFHPNQSS